MRAGLLATAGAALPRCLHFVGSKPPPFPENLPRATPWPEANAILAKVTGPVFPPVDFPIGDSGDSIQGAIDACSLAGGGHVRVPAGDWLVGAIRLKSNVDLNLAAGATLRFSSDARRFPKVLTRYEGIECLNRSPMIYASGETNIALTGAGVLDASGTLWNSGADRATWLDPLVARGVPPEQRDVSGQLRASFVEPYDCRNVLIQGVTLTGARFWQLHPTLCSNVIIDGVTTTVGAPNTDGCDPESCDGVVIKRCTLASGDDNLALKSGRDADGRRVNVPCRNVVIINNQAEGRFGFLTLGSELTGGIENVYAYNNWTYGQGVGYALWIKSNSRRGGFARNINVDTFTGAHLRSGVVSITMAYDSQAGQYPPAFSAINLSKVVVAGAPVVLDVQGLPGDPIAGLSLRDSTFTGIDGSNRIAYATGVELGNVTINGH